jgi:hypothetical protein
MPFSAVAAAVAFAAASSAAKAVPVDDGLTIEGECEELQPALLLPDLARDAVEVDAVEIGGA